MPQELNVFEHANEIMQKTEQGVLVTTKRGEQVNTMAICWGGLGRQWGKNFFILYLRKHRYTKEILDETGEFTVNIPVDALTPEMLAIAGRQSGRDIDKIKALGLTLVPPRVGNVPAIQELPLTLECRVFYKQLQDKHAMSQWDKDTFYPTCTPGSEGDLEDDFHTAYYGEIISAYRLDEA